MREATNILGDIINIHKAPESELLLPELNKIMLTGLTINDPTWN